ncbi:hypothetical protein [Burkholderia sp. PU8-34]
MDFVVGDHPKVITETLTEDDLNQELVALIREDCHGCGEPSSHSVEPRQLFSGNKLTGIEACVVVTLPGWLLSDIPFEAEILSVCVETTPHGRIACFLLRGKKVSLPLHAVWPLPLPEDERLLIIYVCDNGISLEHFRFTEDLIEQMWLCDMTTQFHAHPSHEEFVAEYGSTLDEHPIIVARNLTVGPVDRVRRQFK